MIELREAMPGEDLPAGAGGAIVDVFDRRPPIYEVEFADTDGSTVAMVTLRVDQVAQRDGSL